jgi:hypothetical protein
VRASPEPPLRPRRRIRRRRLLGPARRDRWGLFGCLQRLQLAAEVLDLVLVEANAAGQLEVLLRELVHERRQAAQVDPVVRVLAPATPALRTVSVGRVRSVVAGQGRVLGSLVQG